MIMFVFYLVGLIAMALLLFRLFDWCDGINILGRRKAKIREIEFDNEKRRAERESLVDAYMAKRSRLRAEWFAKSREERERLIKESMARTGQETVK